MKQMILTHTRDIRQPRRYQNKKKEKRHIKHTAALLVFERSVRKKSKRAAGSNKEAFALGRPKKSF